VIEATEEEQMEEVTEREETELATENLHDGMESSRRE
jgi:hypothetical protein